MIVTVPVLLKVGEITVVVVVAFNVSVPALVIVPAPVISEPPALVV